MLEAVPEVDEAPASEAPVPKSELEMGTPDVEVMTRVVDPTMALPETVLVTGTTVVNTVWP